MHTIEIPPPRAQRRRPPAIPAHWSKGLPPTYAAALERLARVRVLMEAAIAEAIDQLDALDAADEDLEESDPVGAPTTIGAMQARDSEDSEPWLAGSPPPNPCIPLDAEGDDADAEYSLGAPEAVTCSEGLASPVRKPRGKPKSDTVSDLRVDRSCDQSKWSQGHDCEDAELDTADEEPSLGAPEQRLSITTCVNGYWFTRPTDQADWAAGCSDDREGNLADVADDRERGDVSDEAHDEDTDLENTAPERLGRGFQRCAPDDMEPSLGSPEACLALGARGGKSGFVGFAPLDQTGWAGGAMDDREGQHEGYEPDDADYEDDARRAPRVPVGIGFDGAIQQLVVARVVEDGGIIALGTVEVANG